MNRLGRGLAVLGMTIAMGAVVAPTAGAQGANDAVELCRQFDDGGVLDSIGITRGECVNQIKGTNEASSLAGACGIDFVQIINGTTNKGQCIQALKSS